jgi:RimJ/RimL family protein N-acetyltransferase
VLLRAAELQDWPAFLADATDPVDRPKWSPLQSPDEAWTRFVRGIGYWTLLGMGRWTVDVDGQNVGAIGVFQRQGQPDVEIGWNIHRAWRGRGLATSAARLALGWALRERGIPLAVALIDFENRASQRVAEGIGMVREGNATLNGAVLLRYLARTGG